MNEVIDLPVVHGLDSLCPHRNTSGITPIDVRVLLLPDPVEEKTSGGIILADSIRDKQKFAAVNATLIGKGRNAFAEMGSETAGQITPGTRVIVAQYAGARVKGLDKQEYVLCNDEDVIAILKEAND